jgi:hypothetical protein
MYLTTMELDGVLWAVELRVIHEGRVPGTLEFSFVRSRDTGQEVRYTWDVPSELVDVLHLEGQINEQVLREQLAKAMTEARTVDALGSRTAPVE